MPDYFTYQDQVVFRLKPGQTVGFTPGKGYYVKGTPSQAPVRPTEVVSEHGQGGGSSSSDTGARPTADQTTSGAATLAAQQPTAATSSGPVSEHGQGGGSGPSDAGAKPTTTETTGYVTHPAQPPSVQVMLRPAATAGADDRPSTLAMSAASALRPPESTALVSDAASGGGYGNRYYTYQDEVVFRLKPGQSVGYTRGKGYYVKGSAAQTSLTTEVISEHGKGGGSASSDTGQARARGTGGSIPNAGSSGSFRPSSTRTLSGVPRIPGFLSGLVSDVHEVTALAHHAGVLLEHLSSSVLKLEYSHIDANAKLGHSLVDYAKKHPEDVAAVAAVLAVVTTGPLALTFLMLSVTASGGAGIRSFKEHKYTEGILDVTAAAMGVSALGPRYAEMVAADARASASTRLTVLDRQAIRSKDIPPLNPAQRAAVKRLAADISEYRQAASSAKKLAIQRDAKAALIAIYADPHIDPALPQSRR